MLERSKKRPRDPNQRAYQIMLESTGQVPPFSPYMHYNFCRIHQILRVTPAMEAGIANHAWEIRKLVALLG